MKLSIFLILLIIFASSIGCGSDSTSRSQAPKSIFNTSDSKGMIGEPTAGRLGPAQSLTDSRVRELAAETDLKPGKLPKKDKGSGVSTPVQCPNLNLNPTTENLKQASEAVLCLVNAMRVDNGQGSLNLNLLLSKAALAHAEDMVNNKYFAHRSPSGGTLRDRARAAGYLPSHDNWGLGENLAWGSGALATPEQIVQGWMNSEGHRQNMLDPAFEDLGVGIIMGSPSPGHSRGAIYAANFGYKSAPAAAATQKGQDSQAASKAKKKKCKRKKRRCKRR